MNAIRSPRGVGRLAFVVIVTFAVFSVTISAQWAGLLNDRFSRQPPAVGEKHVGRTSNFNQHGVVDAHAALLRVIVSSLRRNR